jgi:hypothetical protein
VRSTADIGLADRSPNLTAKRNNLARQFSVPATTVGLASSDFHTR